MNSIKLRVMAQVLPFLLIAPGVVLAQTAPTRGEAAAAMKAGPQKAATQYSRQQIDQMIAPIALYPDQLLAQVLMAATYPQQLVEAATWLADPAHAQLQGDALMAALEPLEWDPSVKALMAVPQVIVLMTEHIEWTGALGVAFATQQAQVMNRVQALRQLAVKSGKIDKVKQVSVRREGPSIVIVSAQPDRVFVPVYNPSVVYGTWPEREFPPVYLPPPRRFAESRGFVVETVESGFEVIGVPVVRQLWGWTRPDWRSERISINTVEYARITRTVRPPQGNFWRHEGPVMLVGRAAAARPAGPAAAMPAGTVAPVAAAAVVALPQRAQAQPNAIQMQTPAAAAAPSAIQPTPAPAATAQPSPAQPSPTQPSTTTAQPSAPPASTTTAQPGTTPPAQTPPASAKPSTTESAAKPATTSSKPGTAEAEKDRKPAAHTGTAKPGDTQAATPPATSKPGTAEAEKDRKPAAHTGTGKPSDTRAATPPAAVKPAEPTATQADKAKPAGAPAHEPQTGKKEVGQKEPAPAPAAKTEPPAAAPAAERTKERGQAGAGKPAAEPTAKAAPEQAGAKPAAVPPPPAQERAGAPPPRAPEQATAKPPAPAQTGAAAPPAHGGQRPPAAEPAQGSSAPPAKPGAAAPGQRPHEAGKAPAPGRPEAADKQER